MRSKIRLHKSHLDHFRRLAKNSALEIQAYLIGEVVSPDLTVVESFAYTKEYAEQTDSSVAWYKADYENLRHAAEERGKRVVGQIHSHPEWDAVMSSRDYAICTIDGSRVCGIVSVNAGKTLPRFWTTDSPLPCEIVYAKTKAAPRRAQKPDPR